MLMAKYLCTLRRGWKWDVDPVTGNPRDDWAAYESQENHQKPLEGELVLEYDNGIPRLKIGDGINEFSTLPYMSVDSFILPKQISVTLYGSEDAVNSNKPQWAEEVDKDGNFLGRYKQQVTVANAVITANSKVDLNPTPEMLAVFHEKDVTFVAENEDGIVTVYCIGQKPKNTYKEIPVTVTEVVCDA
jgi:hypothetical protein